MEKEFFKKIHYSGVLQHTRYLGVPKMAPHRLKNTGIMQIFLKFFFHYILSLNTKRLTYIKKNVIFCTC